jgi:pimeloyl-ACP methyl ester carboxylesterase
MARLKRVGAEHHLQSPAHDRPATNGSGPPRWEQVDWRAHQSWVSIEGHAINTIQLGDGPAILFIHGLSGCWANWLEQLCPFAATNRLIAVDLPGFGHSPGFGGEISMEGYARLMVGLLSELGIARASVVGNSMGGLIAAELAAAHPDRVERLVLISAAGMSTYRDRLTRSTLPAVRRLDRLLALGAAWSAANSDSITRRPRLRELALKGIMRHPSRLSPQLAAEQVRGAGTDGFLGALDAIIEYDVRDRLPLISCPTLIVWGTNDRLISVRDAERFAAAIKGSRRVIYADTGHTAMLERPHQFNRLLREFLDG